MAVHGPEIKRGFGLEENTKAVWGLGGTHYGGLQNVRSPIIDHRHIIRRKREKAAQETEAGRVFCFGCYLAVWVFCDNQGKKISCFGVSLFSTVPTQGVFRIKVTGM